jgi:hypothetical protein
MSAIAYLTNTQTKQTSVFLSPNGEEADVEQHLKDEHGITLAYVLDPEYGDVDYEAGIKGTGHDGTVYYVEFTYEDETGLIFQGQIGAAQCQ